MPVASLWIGDSIGPIEIASIKSFLRHQGQFTLFSYQRIQNVPEGVICKDAREIFNPGEIVRDRKSGSPAVHADMFRYRLLQKTNYTWVDLDIVAFRPFDEQMQWIFAAQDSKFYNNAVLRLPPSSQTLQHLLAYDHSSKGVPIGLSGFRELKYRLRNLLCGALPVSRWPWGTLGPVGLSHYLKQTGEFEHSLPVDAFYFIKTADVRLFVEPGALRQEDFPSEAWGVHLWAKELRQVIDGEFGGKVPEGSYLANLLSID